MEHNYWKMMVVSQKMEVSSCNLNFSAHSIEAVIVLTVLKLLTPDFAWMQHFGQVFLAFTLYYNSNKHPFNFFYIALIWSYGNSDYTIWKSIFGTFKLNVDGCHPTLY
jgi:hypothetical protein